MRALETRYLGYCFRSRLEARWAVFFNVLDIGFRYEPEGYDLGGSDLYLPDFWLPKLDCWIEIKPTKPTDEEDRKAQKLAWLTERPVYILAGDCWLATEPGGYEGTAWLGRQGWDLGYMWCECPRCHALGLQFEGRAARLRCGCWPDGADREHNADTVRLRAAHIAAREARF